jgi:alanine-alpha-ketoisovalerate/valine-pyruvate aminotransferase
MFILSLKPDLRSTLFSDFDPALLQALRCTCRLFRDAVTEAVRDQSVARAVARYTRATIVHTGFRACMIRIHSQYGQHVAEVRLWSDENSSGQNLTLLLDGMEFEGRIHDGDRKKLLKDLPVWMSSVDVVLEDQRVSPGRRSRVNMRINVGVSHKDYVFYAPMF